MALKKDIDAKPSKSKRAGSTQTIYNDTKKALNQFFEYIGDQTSKNVLSIKKFVGILSKKLQIFIKPRIKKGSRVLGNFALGVYGILEGPIKGIVLLKSNISEQSGLKAKLIAAKNTALAATKTSNRTIFNYVAPVFAIAVFVTVVSYFGSQNYIMAVSYQGEVIGYVQDEKSFEQAQAIVKDRIVYVDNSQKYDVDVDLAVVKGSGKTLISNQELADNIISCSSQEITTANGVYIDGKFYGAVEDQQVINSALSATLDKYRTDNPTEHVEFANDIVISNGLYFTPTITPDNNMANLLINGNESTKTYTIQEGDCPETIAQKNDVSSLDLEAQNPNIQEELVPGEQVVIKETKPLLQVVITKQIAYEEEIGYQTETIEDANLNKGTTKISRYGEQGITSIVANVQYINGVEVGREVVSQNIIKEPVNELKLIGTKVAAAAQSGSSSSLPASSGSGSSGISLIRPVGSGGYMSCPFGGYSGHKGMDFADSYGANVYAAASGRVIFAGWDSSGFGNCIIIDHGNGVQTLYGHSSALKVSVGQYVQQGSVIAAIGQTGRATGPHCHLELRINGNRINPAPYIH